MITNKALVELASKHVNETYILGAFAPKDNPNWKGPWDCAEFVSWVTFQATGLLLGCTNNQAQASRADAFSGAWARDAAACQRPISIGQAMATAGAVLVRKPVPGAVALAAWAIDALLRIGVDRADADVLALWLTEPDGTAHSQGIGSPAMLEALRQLDVEIGRLLDGLAERGLLERTNILVTSDHGFSTHNGETSVGQLLVDADLKESAQSTDVVVAGDAIHIREGGQARVDAIVRLLQQTDWIGPVFTRGAAPDAVLGVHAGTVSFQAIGWDHARSADILTSAGWTDIENEYGWRGEVLTTGTAGHGSSSPWDVHATFIAAGPGIKRNVVSPVATGNIDILPTTLALLGQPVPAGLDGRVLSEALATGPQPGEVSFAEDPISTSVELGDRVYELTVHRTRVGSTVYFDGTDVTRSPR